MDSDPAAQWRERAPGNSGLSLPPTSPPTLIGLSPRGTSSLPTVSMPPPPSSSGSGTSVCSRAYVCTPGTDPKTRNRLLGFAASRGAVETAVCAKPGSCPNKPSDQSVYILLHQVHCQHGRGQGSRVKCHPVTSRWCTGKEPACQRRRCKRRGLGPWVGKIPWSRKANPLQYSCLENLRDRGAQWATVSRVAESDTTEYARRTLI